MHTQCDASTQYFGTMLTLHGIKTLDLLEAQVVTQPFSLKGPHNEICVTLDPLGKILHEYWLTWYQPVARINVHQSHA